MVTPSPIKNWRWDLIAIGAVTFLWAAITTPSSAYFLHFNTSTQNQAALELVRGCWEFSTEKMATVLLLSGLFLVFGPSPHIETVILLIGLSVSVVIVYELARLIGKSTSAGIFAVLLVLALPAFQFYGRTYLGHPIPLLLSAWLAAYHRRWGWAGLFFGLSLTSHFIASLAWVGISLGIIVFFFWRSMDWKMQGRLVVSFVIPLLVVEAVFFAYLGIPFLWLRGIFSAFVYVTNLSPDSGNRLIWIFERAVGSNGIVLSGILSLGFLAPFILFKKDKVGLALSLACISLVGAYTLQGYLGRGALYAKALAPLYPFWVICTAIVLVRIVSELRPEFYRPVAVIVGLLFTLFVIQTSLFMHQFTQTLYPILGQWIQQAAEEKRPVRFVQGSAYTALFFARINGAELLAIDGRWVADRQPGQAVLIFSDVPSPADFPRSGYEVTILKGDASLDTVYPSLFQPDGTEVTIPRYYELWWPSQPAEPLDSKPPAPAVYYSGSGCVTPPPYEGGTLYFYQLVFNRLTSRLFGTASQ